MLFWHKTNSNVSQNFWKLFLKLLNSTKKIKNKLEIKFKKINVWRHTWPDPPLPPVTIVHKSRTPPPKVRHTFEQFFLKINTKLKFNINTLHY